MLQQKIGETPNAWKKIVREGCIKEWKFFLTVPSRLAVKRVLLLGLADTNGTRRVSGEAGGTREGHRPPVL